MPFSFEKFAKFVYIWIIPQGFARAIMHVRNRRKTNHPNSNTGIEVGRLASKNKKFYNLHQSERCFILATGPSVKKQDLLGLANEICLAVGQFHLHENIKEIKPRYHVVAPSHPPFCFKDMEKLFDGFEKSYDDDVTFFFGHTPYEFSIKNYLDSSKGNALSNANFIDYSNSIHINEQNHNNAELWDIAESPFGIRTVIYEAIQIAVYMGFKEIYLVGCDHDYLLEMNRVTNHHFYAEDDGLSDAQHLASFTTERWFEEYYFRWQQYRLMKDYCLLHDIKIFNATDGGLLDVFPRVVLNDIIKQDHQK